MTTLLPHFFSPYHSKHSPAVFFLVISHYSHSSLCISSIFPIFCPSTSPSAWVCASVFPSHMFLPQLQSIVHIWVFPPAPTSLLWLSFLLPIKSVPNTYVHPVHSLTFVDFYNRLNPLGCVLTASTLSRHGLLWVGVAPDCYTHKCLSTWLHERLWVVHFGKAETAFRCRR